VNPLDKPQADPSTPMKKAYSRPQLQVYGDLRKITNNVGKHGALDGGGGGNPNHVQTKP